MYLLNEAEILERKIFSDREHTEAKESIGI